MCENKGMTTGGKWRAFCLDFSRSSTQDLRTSSITECRRRTAKNSVILNRKVSAPPVALLLDSATSRDPIDITIAWRVTPSER